MYAWDDESNVTPQRQQVAQLLTVSCMQGDIARLVTADPIQAQLWELRAPAILEKAALGLECFDCEYYLQHNEDLAAASCWEVFTKFINQGQFELRRHRYVSVLDMV